MDARSAESKDPAGDEETLFQKLKPNYGSVPGRPPPVVPDQPKFEVPSKDDGKVALEVEGGSEERSVAGRKIMKLPKGKEAVQEGGAKEDPEVKQEMNDILKRSPSMYTILLFLNPGNSFANQTYLVIIFSKTYCPFSIKAKSILLDKYNIVPSPFVVELDEHPLGMKLQNLLAANTDRRTVPNILISGLSVGGGDEIAELHEEGKLIEKIRSLGDKRIVEVRLKG